MAILKLTDICKDYQQGKEPVRVLKNVNLTVEKGDYLAIMGPSGSGKTTLMNLIGCLDVPTSGRYELDGRDLKDLSDDELAEIRNKHIGFVHNRRGNGNTALLLDLHPVGSGGTGILFALDHTCLGDSAAVQQEFLC